MSLTMINIDFNHNTKEFYQSLTMINIEQALKIILAQIAPLRPEISPASSTILGTCIAEDIHADFASPPFDKSIVDGFAVRISDLEKNNWELPLGCEIPANLNGPIELPLGTTAEIMTGAPIPFGADAVFAKEQCNKLGTRIQFESRKCQKAMNILPMGKEYQQGELLLKAGTKITPQRAGILAACGKTSVMAQPAPRVAIISTGTELVEANMKPKGGQIRNSNGPMLVALSGVSGALPKYLGIAGDCKKNIKELLTEAESSDAIIFCGGVSAGKYDLIPEVLQESGAKILIHKINLKPGKPFLLAISAKGKPVFGLPGNPCSVFVCFHLFVAPAIAALQGETNISPKILSLPITESFYHESDRDTCFPAKILIDQFQAKVKPGKWFGSADLKGLSECNALLLCKEGVTNYKAGDLIQVLVTGPHFFSPSFT